MIGIITSNQDTFSNPTLFAILQKLNLAGIPAIIFTNYQQQPIPSQLKLTNYFIAPPGPMLPKRPDLLYAYFKALFRIKSQIKKHRIKHILAIDPSGLIISGRLKQICRQLQIHYFSFEIFFAQEIRNSPYYKKLKQQEILFTKYVSSIVVQDEVRKENLIRENHIKPSFDNWHLIPVSPISSRQLVRHHRNEYGIKENQTVYIHSGSVASWTGIDKIIALIEDGIPENVILFIHSRSKLDHNNSQHQKLFDLTLTVKQVIWHDDAFDDYEDYLSFLSIFDYGIVLYQPDDGIYTGKNIQDIGLASGKFSSYMAAGLPSLLHDCELYRQFTENYSIGKVVPTHQSLADFLKKEPLKFCKKQDCISFYDELLNPEDKLSLFIANSLK